VDSAENCANAVHALLARENLEAPRDQLGTLQVALTDPPDSFLSIAHDALQLEIGEVELRQAGEVPRA